MQIVVSESSDDDPGGINEKSVPDLHLFFRVDRFIDRIVERMERVKSGLLAEELIKQDEAENWTGDFSVDADGHRVLIGLTRAESEEYTNLMALVADDRASEAQLNRYGELEAKHVYARAWRDASRKPQGDDDDFMRAWSTDDRGARVMIGLSADETEEFIKLNARDLANRMSEHCLPWASVEEMHQENDRLLQLHDKHNLARIARIAAEGKPNTS